MKQIGWLINQLITLHKERDNLDSSDPLFSVRLQKIMAEIQLTVAQIDNNVNERENT